MCACLSTADCVSYFVLILIYSLKGIILRSILQGTQLETIISLCNIFSFSELKTFSFYVALDKAMVCLQLKTIALHVEIVNVPA